MKSFFKFALVACFIAGTISVAAPASANVDKATNFVSSVADKVIAVLNSGGSKAAQQEQIIDIISSHVDIKWIGKFVMGRHWRSATPAQQAAYLKHYEDFILKSYADRFTDYQGSGYTMLNSRQDGEGKYTVKMVIDVDGKKVPVDYRLRQDGSAYNIYDLNVEGVSLINTQRSEFNAIIQNKGMDYLIQQLASKS